MYSVLKRGSFLIFFLLLISCSVSKSVRKRPAVSPTPTTKSQIKTDNPIVVEKPQVRKLLTTDEKVAEYLRIFGPIAQTEMRKFKIPASITLAQGLLESGFGEGRLAIEGNNHFGIKCHSGWDGKRIYHDDDEKGECFRVYEDARSSYRDHSLFLSERNRYAFLFRLGEKDYRAWAKGLKKAGYATDPKYPQKLIRLIDRFELNKYDGKKPIVVDMPKPLNADAKSTIYIVQKGDTLYSISKKLSVNIKELVKLNRIKDNTIYLGQQLILPKK